MGVQRFFGYIRQTLRSSTPEHYDVQFRRSHTCHNSFQYSTARLGDRHPIPVQRDKIPPAQGFTPIFAMKIATLTSGSTCHPHEVTGSHPGCPLLDVLPWRGGSTCLLRPSCVVSSFANGGNTHSNKTYASKKTSFRSCGAMVLYAPWT